MARKNKFWSGFGVGIGIGAGVGLATWLMPELLGTARDSRIIRLEKSIQIGRPVEEVFESWMDFDEMPRASEMVCSIVNRGDRSHWRIELEGSPVEWEAEIEQLVPNQAVGWKSLSGPKHTGRMTFAPLENDTVVHVTMNYVPPSRLLRPFLASMGGQMELVIEKVLREFKAAMEQGSGRTVRTGNEKIWPGTEMSDLRGTGTYGGSSARTESFSGLANPMASPTERKS